MPNGNNTKRILLVFSNQDQLSIIKELLKGSLTSYECTDCFSLSAANTVLKTSSQSFQISLVDFENNVDADLVNIKEFLKNAGDIPVVGFFENAKSDRLNKAIVKKLADVLYKKDLNTAVIDKVIQSAIKIKSLSVQLSESENLYKDFVNNSPQPMCVYESNGLKILDVNETAVQHYGYSRTELMSKNITDLFYPADHEALNISLGEIKNGKEKYLLGNYRHVKKSGEIIQVELQGYNITYKNKKAQLMVICDVTERLTYLNTIEQQYSKLLEIAWIQSHVVRVPLARIMGIIDVIKNYSITEIEKSNMMEHLLNSANELDNLIRNISDKTE